MNFDEIMRDTLPVILSAAKDLRWRHAPCPARRFFAALRMTGLNIPALFVKIHQGKTF
jgi:hypothetical protein